MTDAPTCGTCRFWIDLGNERLCRRYPPQAVFIPASASGATITQPHTLSFFPGMQASGWCGEHRPVSDAAKVIDLYPEIGDGRGMR